MQLKEKNNNSLKITPWSVLGVIIVLAIGIILINYIIRAIHSVLLGIDQGAVAENRTTPPANYNVLETITPDVKQAEEEPLIEDVAPVFERIDIPNKNPVESYLIIRQEFSKVRSMDSFIAFIEAYGSAKNITNIQAIRGIDNIIDWQSIAPIITTYFVSTVKSVEEVSSSANETTLKIIFEGGQEVEVIMVRERGGWRLDEKK